MKETRAGAQNIVSSSAAQLQMLNKQQAAVTGSLCKQLEHTRDTQPQHARENRQTQSNARVERPAAWVLRWLPHNAAFTTTSKDTGHGC